MDVMEPFKTILHLDSLRCSYGANLVLDGVGFDLRAGEILGIAGENGAGKSTLVKCIMGLVAPAGGVLERHAPVAAIYQEFNLIGELNVYENIFLGRELRNRAGLLRRREMSRLAAVELDRLGVSIDPARRVGDLSISERQMVEIAKATSVDAGILIMDEPSTLLNDEETERLFGIMREFRRAGKAILFISHKLAEMIEICDRVAVLRDGELVHLGSASELTPPEIARLMVGRELTRLFPEKLPPPKAEPILAVEHLSAGSRVRDVSFTVRPGEILGVAGLAGAGRSELAEAITGLRRVTGGGIRIAGKGVKIHSMAAAREHGIGFLTEDRQQSGLLADFSIEDNISLTSLARYLKCGWIRRGAIRRAAETYIRRFSIKCRAPEQPVRYLSGGNQQKVAIAKNLDIQPRIFIFDEPTRGVDVAARRDIYDFIHDLAADGVACLMICSDLEELLGMCRRVMVMREGGAVGVLEGEALNKEEIMYLATGVER